MRNNDLSNKQFLYHAFLSYSHRRDRQLARAFQHFLERFGTLVPWRRKVRIFRDETNLAAEPSLWDKLSETVDASRYFLLLASPHSAQSPWVQKEIERYLAQKDLSGVIIVLVAGNTPWTNPDLKETESAISQNLLDLYKERAWEPLVIDLRGTTGKIKPTSERLNQAASVVARLLGKNKDDIYGAHIAAQRMAILGLSSIVFLVSILAGVAIFQRQEAQANFSRMKDAVYVIAAGILSNSDPSEAGTILREVDHTENTSSWYQRATEVARQPLSHKIYTGHKSASIDETILEPTTELVATAAQDGTVHFWGVDKDKPIYSIKGVGNVLFMRRFANTTQLFIVWGDLNSVLVDLTKPAEQQRFDLLPAVIGKDNQFSVPVDASLNPDGQRLAIAYDTGLVQVYNVASRRAIFSRTASGGKLDRDTALVEFSDNQHIIVASHKAFEQWQLTPQGPQVNKKKALPEFAHTTKNTHGSLVAALTEQDIFTLRIDDLSIAHQFPRPQPAKLCCESNYCSDPGFTASKGVEHLFSMPSGGNGRQVTSRPWRISGIPANLVFSPSGEKLALVDKNAIALYDLQNNSAILLCGHRGDIRSLRFSPGERTLLTTSNDQTIRSYDSVLGRKLGVFRGLNDRMVGAEFLADGRFVLGAGEQGQVRLWSAEPIITPIQLFAPNVDLIGFDFAGTLWGLSIPKGEQNDRAEPFLRYGFESDKPLITTDLDLPPELESAIEDPNWVEEIANRIPPESDADYNSVRGIAGGDYIIGIFKDMDKADTGDIIKLFDSGRNELASWEVKDSSIAAVSKEPAGKQSIAILGIDGSYFRLHPTTTELNKIAEKCRYGGEAIAAISPSSQHFVVADASGYLCVEKEGDIEPIILKAHTGQLTKLDFDSSGRYLVSSSQDRTIQVWDLKNLTKLYQSPRQTSRIITAAISSNAELLAYITQDKLLEVWPLPTHATLKNEFWKDIGLCLTAESRMEKLNESLTDAVQSRDACTLKRAKILSTQLQISSPELTDPFPMTRPVDLVLRGQALEEKAGGLNNKKETALVQAAAVAAYKKALFFITPDPRAADSLDNAQKKFSFMLKSLTTAELTEVAFEFAKLEPEAALSFALYAYEVVYRPNQAKIVLTPLLDKGYNLASVACNLVEIEFLLKGNLQNIIDLAQICKEASDSQYIPVVMAAYVYSTAVMAKDRQALPAARQDLLESLKSIRGGSISWKFDGTLHMLKSWSGPEARHVENLLELLVAPPSRRDKRIPQIVYELSQ